MVLWKKTIQTCIFSAVLLCAFTSAFATVAEEGFYVGVELGEGKADYKISDIPKLFKFKPTDTFLPLLPPIKESEFDTRGFSGRIFVGYNIFRFFGIELGGAYFPNADMNTISSGIKVEIDGYAAAGDISAKFLLPILDRFGVFARIGGAYSLFRGEVKIRTTPRVSGKQTEGEFTGVWGAGATIAVTPSFIVGVSWVHYGSTADVRKVDFVAATMSYHWVDSVHYCGEFLC